MDDIICESCGVANQAGTEFCLFCGSYLAWDRSVLLPPRTTTAAAPPTAPRTATPHAAPPVAGPPPPVSPESTLPDPGVTRASAGRAAAPTAAAPSPPVVGGGSGCPSCGRINDPGRRFCAKCGQTLGSPVSGTPGRSTTSWLRVLRSRDRAARIAYRRSLPPLYRWRRVLIGVLVAVLGLGGLAAVGRHPVRWSVDRYDDLRQTTVIVPNVRANVDPATASAADTTPAALTDLNEAAWTMTWQPAEQGASCGGAPSTGKIVLTIAPRRIRQIDIQAGLGEKNPDRLRQHRPQSIGVSFDGGTCRSFPLQNLAGPQSLEVDSGVAVSTIEIGVDTAYPPEEGGLPLLSFTEIFLRSRPVR